MILWLLPLTCECNPQITQLELETDEWTTFPRCSRELIKRLLFKLEQWQSHWFRLALSTQQHTCHSLWQILCLPSSTERSEKTILYCQSSKICKLWSLKHFDNKRQSITYMGDSSNCKAHIFQHNMDMEGREITHVNDSIKSNLPWNFQLWIQTRLLYSITSTISNRQPSLWQKDTNSWKSSNTCSSLHSSPARLFSTEKLPLNYGSMNDRDVQSFLLTWNIQIESNFLEPNLTQLEIFELDNFKKLVVLILKQCLDKVMQNHLEEALVLL